MGLRGELIVPCDRKRHFKPVWKRETKKIYCLIKYLSWKKFFGRYFVL